MMLLGGLLDGRNPNNKVPIERAGNTPVLVFTQEGGGNVPLVQTWAWVWTPDGPARVDVEAPIREAIRKLLPVTCGYDAGIDWATLRAGTGVWMDGTYTRKIDVHERVSIQFRLKGNHLIPVTIEFGDLFGVTSDPGHNRIPALS